MKRDINSVASTVEKVINQASEQIGEVIDYTRVVDCEGCLKEIDYKFKSGKLGWVDLLEDRYGNQEIRLVAYNEDQEEAEFDIYVTYREGWENELFKMIEKAHTYR